ncbi:cytochrome P450 [Kitasatospora sp. NPDC101183]|uniref:cytochrome P450 n=1 Tax=Kitasatospora sp. NPDC101183 TaxID=3364100 RepID=UPI0037F31D30
MSRGRPVTALSSLELCDPDLYAHGDPEELWQRMRRAAPVHGGEYDGRRFHAVLSHAEISRVLKDPGNFSSQQGMRLDQNPAATELAAGKMLIITDPPRHGGIRRIVGGAFTPRMVARLEQTMRETVTAALDEALEAGECDFTRVAARLPLSVICDMLGVPPGDRDFMLERIMVAFGSGEDEAADPLAPAEAHADILSYYEELLARRRREPQEDIVTALAHGTVDGVPLTDEEIFLNCDGLVSGGNETTRHASVGGLLALMRHPEQWAALREDPELLPTAVQEILRFTSPAMHVLRTATAPVEVAGHALAPGDQVALWLAAGNRDGTVFADPDRFDVTRRPNPHLTFAAGPHYCLGASLGTRELTVLFEELLRRVGDAELTGPPRRTRSILIRGHDALPVRLVAA